MDRDAMIEEIKTAFKGVTRDRGISWSEARVIDDYGSDKERDAARAKDNDTNWMQVANDPNWHMGVGSRFAFLDDIGFRYYLAAAMSAILSRSMDSWPLTQILGNHKTNEEIDRDCALLDGGQRACVKHFIKHMIQITNDNRFEQDDWRKIYDSYWKHVPEVRIAKRPVK